jgi:hypothetical protein
VEAYVAVGKAVEPVEVGWGAEQEVEELVAARVVGSAKAAVKVVARAEEVREAKMVETWVEAAMGAERAEAWVEAAMEVGLAVDKVVVEEAEVAVGVQEVDLVEGVKEGGMEVAAEVAARGAAQVVAVSEGAKEAV